MYCGLTTDKGPNLINKLTRGKLIAPSAVTSCLNQRLILKQRDYFHTAKTKLKF